MGSETPMTDAFYANKVVQITPEAVGDFLRECKDHASRLESALAVAEEALRSGVYDGRLQTFEDRERWRMEVRAALLAIENIRGGS